MISDFSRSPQGISADLAFSGLRVQMKTLEGYEGDRRVASTDLEIGDSGTREYKRSGINDTLRRLLGWFAPRQSPTSRYKLSTQIQDDCNEGRVAMHGLNAERPRHRIRAIKKSLERSLD